MLLPSGTPSSRTPAQRSSPAPDFKTHLMFRASLTPLALPDFRRLWFGLFISMTGSTLRNAALLWHVTLLVDKSERALALATVGIVRVVPIVLCGLLAGVLADAVDRRRLLLYANGFLFVVSCALACATYLDGLSPLGLYVAVALIAGASTFDTPARTAFYPMLVPGAELPKAVVLMGSAFQVAAMLGPALAGLVIGTKGVALAYALDAASFVVILVSLVRIQGAHTTDADWRSRVSVGAALAGLNFVFRHPLIRASMLLDFGATFLGSATALLPIFAQDILRVGASGYGVLASAIAVGAAATSVFISPRLERVEARGKLLLLAVASYGVWTALFAFSETFWLSFACLFLVGASDTVSTIVRQLVRQLESPSEMRGRMAGVNLIFFSGGPQLGEFEAGLVARAFGPVVSVFLGGIGCVLLTLGFGIWSPSLSQYRRTTHHS
jgi:MFS family permease